MPLRGRATARNFPTFPNGLRSHIGSCALEGPRWSRDRRRLRVDALPVFPPLSLGAVGPWPPVLT